MGCIVLELMGVSLLQYTQIYEKNECVIPLVTVRYIAIQLFNALSFLHGIGGCIHADLKPENVLITLQHSINGHLTNNKYPNIKIVDFGNALSFNRKIKTFQVQSLYYRAPEVLFGNEVTSAIDLWSIGCILFELININKFNKKSYFNNNNPSRRHRRALFACRNKAELAKKIHETVSPYPLYVYNEYKSCYFKEIHDSFNDKDQKLNHSDDRYLILKNSRKRKLISRLNIVNEREKTRFLLDFEHNEFIDLISCLLDLNPSTRYSSEDAIQHPFCINLKYVENDLNILTNLSTKFESSYPITPISQDFDRQYRITQQIERFDFFESVKTNHSSSIPGPTERTITRRNSLFVRNTTDRSVIHNKVICLLNGCCNNPTIRKNTSYQQYQQYQQQTLMMHNMINNTDNDSEQIEGYINNISDIYSNTTKAPN